VVCHRRTSNAAQNSQRFMLLYVNEDNTKPQTENKTHFDCRH
jgi:hypothetical protein